MNIDRHLNIRSNNYSIDIKAHKCQQIPGGRQMKLLECKGIKRGIYKELKKNSSDKICPQQREATQKGKSPSILFVYIVGVTAHITPGHDHKLFNTEQRSTNVNVGNDVCHSCRNCRSHIDSLQKSNPGLTHDLIKMHLIILCCLCSLCSLRCFGIKV